MTTDQPSARKSADSLSDDGTDEPAANAESDERDREIEQLLAEFYAD